VKSVQVMLFHVHVVRNTGMVPPTSMSHVAVQEALDCKVVEWMEKVTDAEYLSEITPD